MPRGIKVSYLDQTFKKPQITKDLLQRVVAYFAAYWKQLTVSITIIILASILGLLPFFVIRRIIDIALPHKDFKLLGILIAVSIGITVLLGLLQVGQAYLNTWIAKRITFNIKNQMYHHLQGMAMSFFASAKPGEIITRITSDIDGIQDIFNSTVNTAFSSFFTVVTTVTALIIMNWKLALLGILILPAFIIPTRKVGKVRWEIASKTQGKISELSQIVQETLSISGSMLMKIFTREADEYTRFQMVNEEVIKLQMKDSLAGRWFFMTITTLTAIGPMLIYLYGGYLFIHGEITIGSIVAFVALLTRLYGPATALFNIHIDVTRSLALFQRIFEYLDQEQEIKNRPQAVPIAIQGKVSFQKVCFSYQPSHEILKDVDFTVKPGTLVALVGASGAGKTTLTNLIPRLYDITGGSVSIDGTDVRDITLDSLRQQIGIVMQEPYLFNETIENNLRYANSGASETEIINACRASYIHDFIMSLPEKYNTVVGNRGIKLSGGEKQRVSIARVILKNPRIIILDEATSALDSVSEMYIQKAMVPLLRGRTSFVIAHRLSTVIAADLLLVLEAGQIVEKGTHQELLAKEGIYKKLYDTQFRLQNTPI
jgi:ATP-binding cassette, subfamily B, bacterial